MSFTSNLIEYKNGIFQGDGLSVLLFISSTNPLSFILNILKGYLIGKENSDDLKKLFAPNMNSMKLLLDLVTQFSKDIGMKFGESKCAYLQIERGRINVNSEYIKINNLNIPTFGLLDWRIGEIDSIDKKKKRKILTMTGNFHKKSDIDRSYMPRKLGGRGVKEIMTAYECRIASAKNHLTQNKKNNKYLNKVIESEENGVIRISNELINQSNIELNENHVM